MEMQTMLPEGYRITGTGEAIALWYNGAPLFWASREQGRPEEEIEADLAHAAAVHQEIGELRTRENQAFHAGAPGKAAEIAGRRIERQAAYQVWVARAMGLSAYRGRRTA